MTVTTELKQKGKNPQQFQKLVFVGGKQTDKQVSTQKHLNSLCGDRFFLCDAQINDRFEIAKIQTDRNTRKYLHQLGFKSRVAIEVVGKISGSIIVKINAQHISLGMAITQLVIVRSAK